MRTLRATCAALVTLAAATASAQAPAQPPAGPACPTEDQPDADCPQPEPAPVAQSAPVAQPAQPAPVAQPVPPPPPEPMYVEPTPVQIEPDPWSLEALGFAMTIGGGVAGFTDSTIRDSTGDGGNWDVRAMIGTRQFVGVEGSYLGSAQSIDAIGLDTDATLVGNGLQANLRLNATKDTDIQPFLYGGVAWRRYDLTGEDFNVSDVADSDDVLELPIGVGVAFKYRGLLLDARGEYRAAFYEDMIPTFAELDDPNDAAAMHRYSINANIGYEF